MTVCLLGDYNDRVEYFKCLFTKLEIPGSHDSDFEIRGELGYKMKQLKDSNHNDKIVDELLTDIHKILELEYSFEIFKQEYMIYLRLLVDREEKIENSKGCWFKKISPVPSLNRNRWNMWGSHKQFIFGRCVVDGLNHKFNYNLHPIWGCLLSPTGGIIGYANNELIERSWDSYISLHSCVHDGGGYLYNYHDHLGCGYNYLDTYFTFFPRYSPLSCQFAGLRFWKKLTHNMI